jgi:hypothetical protein
MRSIHLRVAFRAMIERTTAARPPAAGRRIFFQHSSDHELHLDRSTATWAVGAMVGALVFGGQRGVLLSYYSTRYAWQKDRTLDFDCDDRWMFDRQSIPVAQDPWRKGKKDMRAARG